MPYPRTCSPFPVEIIPFKTKFTFKMVETIPISPEHYSKTAMAEKRSVAGRDRTSSQSSQPKLHNIAKAYLPFCILQCNIVQSNNNGERPDLSNETYTYQIDACIVAPFPTSTYTSRRLCVRSDTMAVDVETETSQNGALLPRPGCSASRDGTLARDQPPLHRVIPYLSILNMNVDR